MHRKPELRQAVYLLQSSNIAEEVHPPSFIFTRRVMRMYEKLALELTALAFLFQCIRFIWKIEIEDVYKRQCQPRYAICWTISIQEARLMQRQ